MDVELYTVRINCKKGVKRYIRWCDEHWYGTSSQPDYKYTLQEAVDITNMMEDHYVYSMTIVGENGETYERGRKNREQRMCVKKNPFRVNRTVLSKIKK